MKSNIFNIQKFSIHDGPGIRTVVFFKGCPLHCLWCSNPESQSIHTQILWDMEKCVHCHLCETSCPAKSIDFKNEHFNFNHDTCTSCMTCINQCPKKALEYIGKIMTKEEVLSEVMKDYDFYEESGGGVTLSGGEVLMHHTFAEELLIELKNNRIHTALETTGYASSDVFQKVVNHADLLLFDIKHYNSAKHKKFTGVPNETIIENMKWAVSNGIEVIARIPVIPNANNSLNDASNFCKLLKEIGIKKINLLPFHQFGQKKYENLHMKYLMKDTKALHIEDIQDYLKVFQAEGFDATI
ncbi:MULTISPECIES: glycyl-radical enzyme activating protein [Clostridium]|uniref:Pyruvate formate lyase activating enzyme n=1 Tax=Clostridium cadaveris TaxID=1529 RepID=A0A1I2MF83_9CLOT|nr:glycyl-radical enzyme activating protein [Clostridium cadaveris]MDM8311492.1 glycyl-radical enzyme activating protein [Clostridium cadaveris]MDU4953932.1 glycyl-radical enzyme activating protein [Clostridium sp.]NME64890.1 glycyl-radical enzyme activating protein [Clostridium cadaveris]SFF89439.1 pyruvate formate lyase activating enzyme [Clostridium cadaveris]